MLNIPKLLVSLSGESIDSAETGAAMQRGKEAEYLSCKLASPVFELYGVEGLANAQNLPPLEQPSQNGHIAYHMKWGDHSIGAYDWQHILDYFEKIIAQSIS